MSERLTNNWTPTAAEAFGVSGLKGDRGEQFMCEVYDDWGWEYEQHPASFQHQVGGVDFSFRKPTWSNFYTCDVKANVDPFGNFFVETDDAGWLFNPKKRSDRIWHVNPDTGWMAWYGRADMKHYIMSIGMQNTGLLRISAKDKIDFITRRRHHMRVDKKPMFSDDIPF